MLATSATATSAGDFAFGGFFLAFGLLWLAGLGLFVYWIVKLVEVCQLTEHQFVSAGSEKTNWILVVALAGGIGALIWQFSGTRKVVRAAPRQAAFPVPGWYPDPAGAGLRWWDGLHWGAAAPDVSAHGPAA